MKIAHKNKKSATPEAAAAPAISADWKSAGKQLEDEGDNEQAIALYTAILKKQSHNAYVYDRLMILYRKEKKYTKELSLITTAIKKFTELLHPHKNRHSKKISNLSKSILHAVGLTNRQGQPIYQPQPIARWEKRRKVILKKVSSK